MSALLTISNFIGGEFEGCCEHLLDSFDPSTGEVWARIPDSGPEEADRAVTAATKAFPGWSGTPVEDRCALLNKLADILERQSKELAETESRDQGKPVSLAAAVDIPRLLHNLRFFAGYVPHVMETSNFLDKAGALNYTTHEPVGVAALIAPWNLPLYLLSFKLAPALACGNTVVCKPSEMTSVTAWMFCKAVKEAGIPPGVVNIVHGLGYSPCIFVYSGIPPGVVNIVHGLGPRVGQALVSHPDVPLISFTGSTATAQRIRQASATMSKKLSLELGGKNPAVIFDDCDLEKCVSTTVRSSFANQGEICLCTSRIFVQRKIYDRFLEMFVQQVRNIRVGDPRESSTQMGALVSKEHMAKVTGYVDVARAEGATVHCGHGTDELQLSDRNKKGYFVLPTVISGMADDSRLMKEEIFGPVTCVTPFDTEDEVVKRANDVEYGLCATLWSQNVSIVHRVAKKLKVGTVWTNCWLVRDLHMPFGGTKNSGIGREGAEYSFDFYTEAKTVCVKL